MTEPYENETEATTRTPEDTTRAPGAVRGVRVILWFQGIVNLFGVVLVMVGISALRRNGQTVPGLGLTYVFLVVGIVIGLAAIICAALIAERKHRWIPALAMVVGGAAILTGVFNLFHGSIQGLLAAVLGGVVIVLLNNPEAKAWLAGGDRPAAVDADPGDQM